MHSGYRGVEQSGQLLIPSIAHNHGYDGTFKDQVMITHISRGGAVWSARVAHNHEVDGSNPSPATKKNILPFGRIFFFWDGFVHRPARRSLARGRRFVERGRAQVLASSTSQRKRAEPAIPLPATKKKRSRFCGRFFLVVQVLSRRGAVRKLRYTTQAL